MGLVDYSDSETSDVEETQTKPTSKPAFQKVIDRSEPRKIKVDLPSIRPEPGQQDEEPRPAKRAKTGGAFSGFNSFLPAPKRTAQTGPKPGVSLKTSSEAAFSRRPAPSEETSHAALETEELPVAHAPAEKVEEPKMVGKATKFRPLSVANKKKPKKKTSPPAADAKSRVANGQSVHEVDAQEGTSKAEAVEVAPATKAKRSLFSVQHESAQAPTPANGEAYEAMTLTDHTPESVAAPVPTQPGQTISNPNSLQSVASDLNLTPAQRRQLFGRNAKDTDINITHFNMDNEYAANEQARQAGEVVEHRAVKSIAPGKHSLQQLVNNARTQQGGLEDKWAEGRRERGEAGGKYGWSK